MTSIGVALIAIGIFIILTDDKKVVAVCDDVFEEKDAAGKNIGGEMLTAANFIDDDDLIPLPEFFAILEG